MLSSLPSWILRLICRLALAWPWLARKLSALAINSSVNAVPHRPHPWSTVSDYVSWESLSDMRWSARHLPAKVLKNLPPSAEVARLFQRGDGQQRLCPKSTCLFPAFAQYLTDGFIRTRMPNSSARESQDLRKQNTSNHQIDLCPLYGRTIEQTAALRLGSEVAGQRGRLKSQRIGGEEYPPFLYKVGAVDPQFAALDPPIGLDNVPAALLPTLFAVGGDRVNTAPQVAMINTLFLREHNRLAGLLERSHPGWDDERVFQTARNCVIVMFIKIVVEEYINHISPSIRFIADPSVAWNAPWNKPNWITTEFSLLYRWHSLMPDEIAWGPRTYPLARTFWNNPLLIESGLERSFTGIAAQRAGRLGAFNTNSALLPREISAIEQGRLCQLASFADYKEYATSPRPTKFSDFSADPRVAALLQSLYKSVDDVEFYVGLFAEDTVPDSPLPPLILRMVAVDAFSQALTNPLLSEHVYQPETFAEGWEVIAKTGSLRDVLARNLPSADPALAHVGMTREGWVPQA